MRTVAVSDVADAVVDRGSFVPISDGLRSSDPLSFPGYRDALARSEADESVVYGPALVAGVPVELAIFDFSFFGGSMGEVAGERLARAMQRAVTNRTPLVLRTSTGGARMQEGMRSLVQMAKVVAARIDLELQRVPLIAVLGHPTTGGVLASIAALADVTIAEEGATVGFAGPRLVEAHTGKRLRRGSHTAAAALQHGLVDVVTDGRGARRAVADAVEVLAAPVGRREAGPVGAAAEIQRASLGQGSDAWGSVGQARDEARPTGGALGRAAAERSFELRGDRAGSDDAGVVALLARVGGMKTLVVALDRTHPTPAGYRKAHRAIDTAARLQLPVVTIVDTPGADPSEPSEAGGIAWAIARLFEKMIELPVPVLSIVTGEGGSGGALAFAVADRLLMWEGSIFSVTAPEAAANILWRDPERAPEAARHLRLTASDMVDLRIADGIVVAPLTPGELRKVIVDQVRELATTGADRAPARRTRWRNV